MGRKRKSEVPSTQAGGCSEEAVKALEELHACIERASAKKPWFHEKHSALLLDLIGALYNQARRFVRVSDQALPKFVGTGLHAEQIWEELVLHFRTIDKLVESTPFADLILGGEPDEREDVSADQDIEVADLEEFLRLGDQEDEKEEHVSKGTLEEEEELNEMILHGSSFLTEERLHRLEKEDEEARNELQRGDGAYKSTRGQKRDDDGLATLNQEEEDNVSDDMEFGEDEDEDEDEEPLSEDEGHDEINKAEHAKDSDSESDLDSLDMDADPSTLTEFQKRQLALKKMIHAMEERTVHEEKPWDMKGEATKKDRPKDSLLQASLEFERAYAPKKIEITPEVTQTLEEMIKQRVKDKIFDDVIMTGLPASGDAEEAGDAKTKNAIDTSKSRLSLAELYAGDYIRKNFGEEEESLKQEYEYIRTLFRKLVSELDACSKFGGAGFTSMASVGTKPEEVDTSVPALVMEEVIPDAISSAKQFAPEELMEHKSVADDPLAREKRKKTKKKKRDRGPMSDSSGTGIGKGYGKTKRRKTTDSQKGGQAVDEGHSKASSFKSANVFKTLAASKGKRDERKKPLKRGRSDRKPGDAATLLL
eukprot:TRINITY_DN1247_c1_g1_i1.p1 TRINITY_DN1247_c1_g1~~TRINITY_DN1247_c1_g1_i1.p1  ORF type:complete len:593 (-),score=199.78 TRINITY_DN1247_c1_g1_i1:1770-3548(-)